MKRWINKKIRFFWWLKHSIPPMWTITRGGWFNFRNSPDLVVRMYSMILKEARERGDEDMTNLCLDARQEWRARVQQREERND